MLSPDTRVRESENTQMRGTHKDLTLSVASKDGGRENETEKSKRIGGTHMSGCNFFSQAEQPQSKWQNSYICSLQMAGFCWITLRVLPLKNCVS